jgi:hypothetical protein
MLSKITAVECARLTSSYFNKLSLHTNGKGRCEKKGQLQKYTFSGKAESF